MKYQDFLRHYITHAPQLMWFLGAGTSRTAGMPTAADIIWDLKRRYYCLQENQDIQNHDINKDVIKRRIQAFMDSKGFPALWSPEEYSFYFNLTFREDYSAQQKYISEQLATKKISLNIGQRILAALLELAQAKLVFTTNFDEVIETAFSEVTGKNLPTYHLEGSYAALEALNSERFPIYAKIHGDFKYQSIKNLSEDLLHNDQQIQKCFAAASNRYGLVVSGYSGRDQNVMDMFRQALNQNNPFPRGLFWTVPQASNILDSVTELITEAKQKNVNAHIVETGTFDILLLKIWRQLENRPDEIDKKVRTAISKTVSIPLPPHGTRFPILRTNALPVTQCPEKCAQIELENVPTLGELKQTIEKTCPQAVIIKTDKILAWGDKAEISKGFDTGNIKSIKAHNIDDLIIQIGRSTLLKSFYEEAVARALVGNKPLLLKRTYNRYYLVVDHKNETDPSFQSLKEALGFNGKLDWITGRIKGKSKVFWAESVSLKLEQRNGSLWLLLRPDIWVDPLSERQSSTDFLRQRRRYRYNPKSYALLDAWIRTLFGSVGGNQEIGVSCFPGTDFPAEFTIKTRSAYSLGEAG